MFRSLPVRSSMPHVQMSNVQMSNIQSPIVQNIPIQSPVLTIQPEAQTSQPVFNLTSAPGPLPFVYHNIATPVQGDGETLVTTYSIARMTLQEYSPTPLLSPLCSLRLVHRSTSPDKAV